MVRQALDEEGGVEYLRQVARDHPQAFLSLLGRLIPAEFKAEISTRPLVRITDYTGVKWEALARQLPKSDVVNRAAEPKP